MSSHEFADSRAVHILHFGEVQNDLPCPLLHQSANNYAKDDISFADASGKVRVTE